MGKLTPRQRTFLRELVKLCREEGHAVHYSLLAERLGVNRFSAYDMLKLLEDKGLARSDYILDGHSPGPGRSQVVFFPTPQASAMFYLADDDRSTLDDWAALKDRMLTRIGDTGETAYRELLQEILSRLPERRYPLTYCTEMIAALLLNLNRVKSKVIGVNPFDALERLTAKGELGLGALAGLSLGSALAGATDRNDRSLVEALYAGVQRYQDSLASLNEESKRRLSEFIREAIGVFASQGTTG
jgi:hypothetical protein